MRPALTVAVRAILVASFVGIGFARPAIAVKKEFHGNVESHVFHGSECRYFDCKNCSEVFATVKEAMDAGYRPCGVCKPAESRKESKVGVSYTGNTKSHIFHKSSCRNAGCKNCSASFASRDDAIKAGYKPGGCCHP